MTQNRLGPMLSQNSKTDHQHIGAGKNDRTLYLHIGLHKTGTSSLQRSLSKDRWRLQLLHGLKYFKKRYAGPNLNRMVSWSYTKDANFGIVEPVYEAILQDLRKSKLNTIISSEDLSLLSESDVSKLSVELNDIFGNIKIIIYLRRQDRMAVSLKSQGVKTPQQMILMGVEDTPLPIKLRASAETYLSYDKLYLRWSNAFPKAEIIIRSYNRSSLVGQDTVEDFYYLIGINCPRRKRIFLNQSATEQESRLMWKLKRCGVSIQDLKKIWKSLPSSSQSSKFLPSKDEAISFMHKFSQSNNVLCDILGRSELFDSNFDEYPERRDSESIDMEYLRDCLQAANSIEGLSDNGKRIIDKLVRDLAL